MKSTKVQTLGDSFHLHDYLCYCTNHVKCGHFHFGLAYSKEISNESWEKHQNIRYESLKESASKIWSEVYFAVSAKTSIKLGVTESISIDQKRFENYFHSFFSVTKWFCNYSHIYLQNSKYSFHCCIANTVREYLVADRQNDYFTVIGY